MTVNRREAFLLFFLGMIALVALAWAFVISPLSKEIEANQLQKSQLENRKLVIDTTIPLAPTLRDRQANRLEEVDKLFDEIESPLLTAEFERWFLPLTTMFNVRILSTSFSQATVSTPDGLVVAVNEPTYKLRQLIDEFNQTSRTPDTIKTSTANLLRARYSYDIATTFPRYQSILDEITYWNTSFFVSSSSYDYATGTATITIDAYTVHKILPDENPKDYSGDYIAGGTNNDGQVIGGGNGDTKGDDDDNPYEPWK